MAGVQSSLVYFHFKYFKTHREKWSYPKHQNYRPSIPTTVGFNLNPLNYRPASITCYMKNSGKYEKKWIELFNIYTQYIYTIPNKQFNGWYNPTDFKKISNVWRIIWMENQRGSGKQSTQWRIIHGIRQGPILWQDIQYFLFLINDIGTNINLV